MNSLNLVKKLEELLNTFLFLINAMQEISKANRERALNPQYPYKKARLGSARLENDMVSMCINVLYKMVTFILIAIC